MFLKTENEVFKLLCYFLRKLCFLVPFYIREFHSLLLFLRKKVSKKLAAFVAASTKTQAPFRLSCYLNFDLYLRQEISMRTSILSSRPLIFKIWDSRSQILPRYCIKFQNTFAFCKKTKESAEKFTIPIVNFKYQYLCIRLRHKYVDIFYQAFLQSFSGNARHLNGSFRLGVRGNRNPRSFVTFASKVSSAGSPRQ